MERKSSKLYTTGEFAKYFDIKKDPLFYYDRIGLFCPAKVLENGYRCYTSAQLDTFWALRSLRELGMSIKDLRTYFDGLSIDKLGTLADEQLGKIDKELEKLQGMRWLLEEMRQAANDIKTAGLGETKVLQLPEKRLLYSELNQCVEDTTGEQWYGLLNDFLSKTGMMGASFVGSVIAQRDIKSRHFGRVKQLFVDSRDGEGCLCPGGLYAIYYHKGCYSQLPAAYGHLLTALNEMNYNICGDAYEEYLVNFLAASNEDDFITKISIPVCL